MEGDLDKADMDAVAMRIEALDDSAVHTDWASRVVERQAAQLEARKVRILGIPIGCSRKDRAETAQWFLQKLSAEHRDVDMDSVEW